MRFTSKSLFSVSVVLLFFSIGCASVTQRSYNMPASYVSFATQEACATAGFDKIKIQNDLNRIEGNRKLIVGFFAGQGGEHINIQLKELNQTTEATIESKKKFVGFLAQRHMDKRIADYIDMYVKENEELKDRIIENSECR